MIKKRCNFRVNVAILTFVIFLSFIFSLTGCNNGIIKFPENKGLIVTFIDVGQGDSILLSFKDGENILIDGGEDNYKALDFLKRLKAYKLDKIIATHPHSDHIDGLTQIMNSNEFYIKSIWTNKDIAKTPNYERFLDAIKKKELKINTVGRGDKIPVGEMKSIPLVLNDEPYVITKEDILLSANFIKDLSMFKYDINEDKKRITLNRNGNILHYNLENGEIFYNEKKVFESTPVIRYKETYLLPFNSILRCFAGKSQVPEFKAKITYKSREVKLDSSTVDSYMLLKGKYLYASLRLISEHLGAQVSWDNIEKKITISGDGFIIEMWIEKNGMYINGVLVDLEVPPLIKNGKTIIPITKIIEYIGGKVEIDFDINKFKASIPENYIEILNPPAKLFGDINNNSMVMMVKYNDVSFLFNADAEKEAEHSIIDYGMNLKSTIYKIGHHASVNSSARKYLRAVNPEVAIYTAGKDNPYGYPHKETIELLKEMNIKYYGTDINGTIMLSTDGKEYSIHTERQKR